MVAIANDCHYQFGVCLEGAAWEAWPMGYPKRRKRRTSVERKLIGVILISALVMLAVSIRQEMLENRLERRVQNRLTHIQQLELRTDDQNRRAALTEAREKARQKQQAIRQQQQSTCRFWIRKIEAEDMPRNRAYRDAACSKVGLAFR